MPTTADVKAHLMATRDAPTHEARQATAAEFLRMRLLYHELKIQPARNLDQIAA